jgi:hypothetical protein
MREKQRLRTYFWFAYLLKDSCPACRKKKCVHCFSSMSSTIEQVLYPKSRDMTSSPTTRTSAKIETILLLLLLQSGHAFPQHKPLEQVSDRLQTSRVVKSFIAQSSNSSEL